jgi:hypothetical protein
MSVRKVTVDEKIDLVQNPKRKLAGAETGRNPASRIPANHCDKSAANLGVLSRIPVARFSIPI